MSQAAGSLGPYILRDLQRNDFDVTVVSREGSQSSKGDSKSLVTVPADYPENAMIETFRDHDAVILCSGLVRSDLVMISY